MSRAGNAYRAPCPICARGRGDSALSVKLEGGRALLHCFRCESPYGDLLAALGLDPRDLRPSFEWTPPTRTELTPDEQQRAALERLWGEGFPLHPLDVGGQYLKHRGLSLESYPSSVRIHGQVAYWHKRELLGYWPALLSRVEGPGGDLRTLHVTYLERNGRDKADVPAPKKLKTPVYPGAVKGAAIRLYPVQGGRLAVAEGLETALAVRQATGWPVWASISAGGMEALELPQNVSELIVCADNDTNGRGLEAAYTLARRALERGLMVRLAVPPREGQDWLNVLLEGEVSGLLEAPRLSTLDLLRSTPATHATPLTPAKQNCMGWDVSSTTKWEPMQPCNWVGTPSAWDARDGSQGGW